MITAIVIFAATLVGGIAITAIFASLFPVEPVGKIEPELPQGCSGLHPAPAEYLPEPVVVYEKLRVAKPKKKKAKKRKA